MSNFRNKCIHEIAELSIMLDLVDPWSKEYHIYINHLMLFIYTEYEKKIKEIMAYLHGVIKRKYVYDPITSFSRVTKEKWTPDLTKGSMEIYFPILKEWDFWKTNEYTYTNTLVIERHKYAHGIPHSAKLDQILLAYVEIDSIIGFLESIYHEDNMNVDSLTEKLFDCSYKVKRAEQLNSTLDSINKNINGELDADSWYRILRQTEELNIKSLLESIPNSIKLLFSINIEIDLVNQNDYNSIEEISSYLNLLINDVFITREVEIKSHNQNVNEILKDIKSLI